MANLLQILGSNVEDASVASSTSCACDGQPLPDDTYKDMPAFGYEEKLALLTEEQPDAQLDGYVLFGSHTDALALFEVAKAEGLDARISPTPRMARASCGIALLLPCKQIMTAYELATKSNIAVENLVPLPRQINAKRDRYC